MATSLTNGLRALRIPALKLCRAHIAAYPYSFSLRRQLSTSVPRFTAAATAQATAVDVDVDVAKPVSLSEENHDEPVPFSTLRSKVSKETLDAITRWPFKLTHMTPVQKAVFSMLPELSTPLKKNEDGSFDVPSTPRDLMVRAKTGTGKTLAFLVPAIESRVKAIEEAAEDARARAGKASDRRLVENAKRTFAETHIGALILSPTRELAKQISDEADRLCTHHGFKVHLLRGGDSAAMQLREWKRGRKDIVVATTGRLLDLMDRDRSVLEAMRTAKLFILDEADTMLDMGFRPDIDAILPKLPPIPERQTFLFSATISDRLEREVINQALNKDHVFINTVSKEESPVHAHVPQYHTVLTSAADQLPHTLRLIAHDQLTNPGKSKIIIFLPTTKLTQLYATLIRELASAVLPAGRETKIHELHSKRSMEQRSRTSDRFRHDDSGASVLITSDVSARGVHYPGVTRIIQLGVPSSSDQYIHRIGRTGRAGSTGRGDLVLLPWEHGYVRYELHDLPLKPVTSHDLEKQVSEIAERHDEDPEAFFAAHESAAKPESTLSKRRSQRVRHFPRRVAARLQGVREEIDEVLSSVIEEEDVRETFASLLGFYAARDEHLGTSRRTILEGLRDWTVQAAGLSEPPYVSEAFLNKIGFGRDRNTRQVERKFLGRSGHSGKSNAPRNRWDGRGSSRAKARRAAETRESNDWQQRRRDVWPPRRDSDASERRDRWRDRSR